MSAVDGMKRHFYPETAVGGFSRVDGTIEFYNRINALLREDMVVVDLGAGRGSAHIDDPVEYRRKLRSVKGRCRKVIGLEVDDAVCTNPSLDEACVISPKGRFPLADETVDLMFSDATFEHVEDPGRFGCRDPSRPQARGLDMCTDAQFASVILGWAQTWCLTRFILGCYKSYSRTEKRRTSSQWPTD